MGPLSGVPYAAGRVCTNVSARAAALVLHCTNERHGWLLRSSAEVPCAYLVCPAPGMHYDPHHVSLTR